MALWVATTSITLSSKGFPLRYIQKACEAINTAGLRFIPTHGQPPEFSERLHERFSVLSQIIYFENYLFLACGGAEPTMTARIEEEFRYQLPVRPSASRSFMLCSQCTLIGSLSSIVQNLPVGHAYENYFAGQRYGAHPCPPSD